MSHSSTITKRQNYRFAIFHKNFILSNEYNFELILYPKHVIKLLGYILGCYNAVLSFTNLDTIHFLNKTHFKYSFVKDNYPYQNIYIYITLT